ncbi:uncharacterized protein MONBRDRAFT_34324 [Monosiga brevicollis MX1]|uniref:HMG box domain-containing protein n=1 Tax=Monosiga brevicollis TaxID=81824 RepID=A9VAY7_MONBE|nr:uncharacterized protein MONBRDRAFT_34324 [Monosiga brevicollis MX1]EDQ85246.1 predicted protein [Monosiga brevicollis MX1]|eukprot:XP_001749867.1 hypothetical protein [Monosiga brevicollis MX1]
MDEHDYDDQYNEEEEEVHEAPRQKRPRQKRAKKDPNKPKNAQSAYMFFSQKVRPQFSKDNPDKKMTDVSKLIGAAWREMSDAAKKPYEEMARRDKQRYQHQMATYVPPPTRELGKRGKRRKDPDAPKKPLTAYFLYAADRRAALRAQNRNATVADIAKIIGAEWKDLSDAVKKPYQDRADRLKSQYQKEVELYKATR